MIGLPCWAIVGVIRSVLMAPIRPWPTAIGQAAFGKTALGKFLFDHRPLLVVVPVAALIVVGKMSMVSVSLPCPPSQPGCLRTVPGTAVPAKALRAMKSASAETVGRTAQQH